MNQPLLAVALLVLAVSPACLLGLLPHPSAFRMANEARAIVEGELQADGSVVVKKRWFAVDGVTVADSIRVRGLADMQMVVDPFGALGAKAVPIEPDAVLLFLDVLGADGKWSAMHHYGQAARGVLWVVGEQVFGYEQAINPGPYVLEPWVARVDGNDIAGLTPAGVRDEITAGIAVRAAWRNTLAIEDLDLRAEALVPWLSPETSPDGRWCSERWNDLADAGEALGEHVVGPLARVVQSGSSPLAVAQAVHILCRLGARAAAAVPSLVGRLRELRGAEPQALLALLQALRDPRAQGVLRDYVLHEDDHVAAAAARGLRACGGADAATLLAARVPGMIFSASEVGGLAVLLDALHEMDAAEAERLLRERFLEWEALTARRDWTCRVRDEVAAAARGR